METVQKYFQENPGDFGFILIIIGVIIFIALKKNILWLFKTDDVFYNALEKYGWIFPDVKGKIIGYIISITLIIAGIGYLVLYKLFIN